MIKFQRKNGQAKFNPAWVNHNGFLCTKREIGVGEAKETAYQYSYGGDYDVVEEYSSYKTIFVPCWDSEILPEKIKTIVTKMMDNEAPFEAFKEYEKYMVRFECNQSYDVVDMEAGKAQKDEQEMKDIDAGVKSIVFEKTYFGYKLISKVSKSTFRALSLQYISADYIDDWFDDMDDFHRVGSGRYLKGWYRDNIENTGFQIKVT